MDLHELFDSVLDDLPPMPDQTAAATESLRRHRIRVRYGLLASACALVFGAGTLSIAAPWRDTGNTVTSADHPSKSAKAAPSTDPNSLSGLDLVFGQHVMSVVQSVWPVAGVHMTSPEGPHFQVGDLALPLTYTVGGKAYTVDLDFRLWADAEFDTCDPITRPAGVSGWSCSATSLPGGMVLKIEHYGPESAPTSVQVHLMSGAEDLDLTVDSPAARGLTDAQLIATAKSAAYRQLFVQAEQRGLFTYEPSFGWIGG